MRVSVIAGLLGLSLSGATVAGNFISVAQPGSQLVTLSEHGRIASGSFSGKGAFRWTRANGAGSIDGMDSIQGMSSWGQPITGESRDANQNKVAALAYSNSNLLDGPVLLGALPGATPLDEMLSTAYDAADDGSAVGLAYNASGNAVAFRWTADNGLAELPRLNPDNYARANAISRDGHVVIGWNDEDSGYRRAVKWVDGQVSEMLDPNNAPVGEALSVNRDGSVIVGTGAGIDGNQAWRWTAATGLQAIGVIGSGFLDRAYAFGVSDDGNLIGGASGFGFQRQAVVWTPATGMILLSDFLSARGIAVPAGWSLNSVTAVSADGKVLGGWGIDPDNAMNSFIIELETVPLQDAILEARGNVIWNDLASGPFSGVTVGTPVTMSFRMRPDGLELDPGRYVTYPIRLPGFALQAGTASDTLVATAFGPANGITNDYPKSDGIHLFESPLASAGTSMEFELFNPGGDMFDSAELNGINRRFGPEFFEKAAWSVFEGGGALSMTMQLESVVIEDECAIFCGRFD